MKTPFFSKGWGTRVRPTLGVDIGSHTIKLVEFSGADSNRAIRRVGRALVPPGAIVDGSIKDPAAVAEVLKSLLHNASPKIKQASTTIAGYSVIVKKITVPFETEHDIEENLIFEAEKYVPFEIDEVYFDFHVLAQGIAKGQGSEIFLVAAKREIVDEYAAVLQEVGLSPAIVDVDAFALGNAFENAFGILSDVVALVDVGAQKTNLNIVQQGASVFARDMAFGGEQLTESIAETTGLQRNDAEQIKISGTEDSGLGHEVASICTEICGLWAVEIRKALDFYKANSKAEDHPVHLLLSGGSALLKGLDRLIDEETHLPVRIFDPLAHISLESDIDKSYLSMISPQMAIATGLALRTTEK